MRKKVVVRIDSGMGNQLFQYACGYAVARETNKRLIIDPYFRDDIRVYELDKFNIDFRTLFVNAKWDAFLERKRYHLGLKYRKYKLRGYDYIQEEKDYLYDESIFEGNANKYLKGFWQSYKYFDKYYNDIKRQFAVNINMSQKALEYIEKMKESTSVSIHVRRTDYVRTQNNVSLNLDYYNQAIKKMHNIVGQFNIFVFSDDKEFVKEIFSDYKYQLVEDISDIEEFSCMQCCKHHIIANSTYSWWAAYLSENKGNVVIAPVCGNWTEDFYLPQWKIINAAFE